MKKSLHSTIEKNRLECITVSEIARVRFGGRTWIIGLPPLRTLGARGWTLTPRKKNDKRPGAIIASTHLKPDGATIIEAFIHEALHVAFPRTKEKRIANGAAFVAKVLRAVERSKVASSAAGGEGHP